jgi:hypothetical protein
MPLFYGSALIGLAVAIRTLRRAQTEASSTLARTGPGAALRPSEERCSTVGGSWVRQARRMRSMAGNVGAENHIRLNTAADCQAPPNFAGW